MPIFPFDGSEHSAGEVQQLYVRGEPLAGGPSTWNRVRYAWVRSGGAWVPCYNGVNGAAPAQPPLGAGGTYTQTEATFLASFTLGDLDAYSDYDITWYDATDGSEVGAGRQITVDSAPGMQHQVYYTVRAAAYIHPLYPGFNRGPGPVVTSAVHSFVNTTLDQ